MLMNNCVPGSRPEMYGIYYSDGHALLGDSGGVKLSHNGLNIHVVLPMIRSPRNFTGERADYRIGLCVRVEYADDSA
jgi:hypothetical protein